jgi:predicted ArsR family transcriptional regulator
MLDATESRSARDVLSQPTRASLFAELATRLGLHPNGVRTHLERLQEAGLVVRARVRQRRGRPPDAWMIAPGASPGGAPPRAYKDLGRWLARCIGRRATGPGGLERAGREIGRELAPADASPGLDAVERALAALGFAPRIASRDSDKLTLCLRNCPYRDVVRENQAAICALHKGITRGLLDVLAPQTKLSAFVPRDPDDADCVIELSGHETGLGTPRALA